MKCFETEKNIDLLLDDEAGELQKQELKAHLALCEDCQSELQIRQHAQVLLKNQPSILPQSAFDKQMLAVFENRKNATQETRQNWWTGLFTIPKPALAFAALLFAVAFGLTFLLGRISVATPPQVVVQPNQNSNVEQKPEEIKPPTVNPAKEEVVANPKIKTVIKYVEVPVVKEKIVERIVYVNRPNQNKGIEKINIKNPPTIAQNNNLANQFNLKDLQPIANVTYKIIRKGEDNEE